MRSFPLPELVRTPRLEVGRLLEKGLGQCLVFVFHVLVARLLRVKRVAAMVAANLGLHASGAWMRIRTLRLVALGGERAIFAGPVSSLVLGFTLD